MNEATPSTSDSPSSNSQGNAAGVYFCEICRKPFTNEQSRKRHLPYCRRTHGRQRTRVRSCQACSLAKTKCSSGTRCSRCASKDLDCIYDYTKNNRSHHNNILSTHSHRQLPKSSSIRVSEGPLGLEDELGISEVGANFFDWSFPIEEAVFSTEICETQASELGREDPGIRNIHRVRHEMAQHVPEIAADAHLHNMPSLEKSPSHRSLDFLQDFVWNDFPYGMSMPMSMSRFQSNCVLKPHVLNTIVAQCSAGLILQTIRAYPQMMLKKPTFPPFIHPHWYGSLPAPLANCMGIAQMFSARSIDTDPFLWRTIRMEQQRLVDGLPELSARELLAATQAYIIYIIMRMSDNTRFTDSDVQMLYSFHMMCQRITELFPGPFSEPEQFEPRIKWEDWIFAESRRRVAVLWFLVSRVVCVTTDIPCDTTANFKALALPSTRILWEAKDVENWQQEYKTGTMPRGMRMSFFGELIDTQRNPNEPSSISKLNLWHSEIDNLGTLLTLSINTF